jgi:hypothetical protein
VKLVGGKSGRGHLLTGQQVTSVIYEDGRVASACSRLASYGLVWFGLVWFGFSAPPSLKFGIARGAVAMFR